MPTSDVYCQRHAQLTYLTNHTLLSTTGGKNSRRNLASKRHAYKICVYFDIQVAKEQWVYHYSFDEKMGKHSKDVDQFQGC